jgi:hypothetical protein
MLRWARKWNEALIFCKPKKMGARSARVRSLANTYYLQKNYYIPLQLVFSEGLSGPNENGGHVTWESLDISCVFSTGSWVSPSALLFTRFSGHRESTGRGAI